MNNVAHIIRLTCFWRTHIPSCTLSAGARAHCARQMTTSMPPELQEAYDAMFKKPSLDDDAAMPTTPEAIEALTTPAAERTSAPEC